MGHKVRKLNRRQNSSRSNSSKVSSVKLTNKRLSKLIKQKVVKPKSKFVSTFMRSQSIQRQQSVININNSNEFDINDVLDLLDANDKTLTKSNKRPKWALKEDNHNDSDSDLNQVEDYERKPRKNVFQLKNDKYVNNNNKFENIQNNNNNIEVEKKLSFDNENNDINDSNDNSLESKSLVQLFAERSVKLDQLKTRIASMATSIIAHPEINMKRLRDLLSMFDIKSDDKEYGLIFLSIQKIVAFAALEVFRDIIPNYRVREKINEEDDENNSKKRNFRLKKETKRLREYEKSLIQLYRLYLLRLERMVQCINKGSKKSNFYDNMLTSRKAKQRIATIGVKCFSELVITHPHFNFRNQIIETIVPLMANNNYKEISDICCETISKLYKSDKLGEISLEAVKCTSKLVKERNFKINPKVLKTFLSLRIKEVKQKDESNKKDMKKIRSKLNLMSRKERKRNKRMQKLNNQLLETEAIESKERKLNFHTEILNQVFVTYFRILKHRSENSDFNDTNDQKWFKAILSPVLEGLSKFAHLINIEFFDDLISVLYGLIRDKQLDDHQCLHCLQTVFTILSGEGSALNIDFQRFYSELYVILLNIDTNTNIDDIQVLISCLNTMIIKRKKQMTNNRVLAFIKRLSTISLQTVREPSIAILSVIRQIVLNHKQSDILLDSEGSSIGSGIFWPQLEDPEHCNANSTLLWELTLQTRHYEPIVRQFASHLLNGCKGNELPLITIKRQPLDLFNELVGDYNEFEFFTRNAKTVKLFNNKSRFQYSLIDSHSSLTNKCNQFLKELDNSL